MELRHTSFATLLIALTITGCPGATADHDDAGDAGGSARDAGYPVTITGSGILWNDASAPTGVPPECGVACCDYSVATALYMRFTVLHNRNIATAEGSVDVMADCPLGGTVHITGTTHTSSEGTDTKDLSFGMSRCTDSSSGERFTFSGDMRVTGRYNNGTGGVEQFVDLRLRSNALEISGHLDGYAEPIRIDETCDVDVLDQYSASTFAPIGGSVCGRKVDKELAFPPTPPETFDAGAPDPNAASGVVLDAGTGVCVISPAHTCQTCGSGSSCASDEACCGNGGLGFCTRQTSLSCTPCFQDTDCLPGYLCCQ
jgi:hypothetical protein